MLPVDVMDFGEAHYHLNKRRIEKKQSVLNKFYDEIQ
jgi:hypothetical protein